MFKRGFVALLSLYCRHLCFMSGPFLSLLSSSATVSAVTAALLASSGASHLLRAAGGLSHCDCVCEAAPQSLCVCLYVSAVDSFSGLEHFGS